MWRNSTITTDATGKANNTPKPEQPAASHDREHHRDRMQADLVTDQPRRQQHAFYALADRKHGNHRQQMHRVLELQQGRHAGKDDAGDRSHVGHRN